MTSGKHAIAVLAAACAAAAGFSGRPAAQNRDPAQPRLVWAAKPVPPTPYVAPNRLIWRIADILAAHKGQASWRERVAVTRDFEGEWVSMAPGEKTKRMFYADDRAFWFVYSGAMRVHLEGQEPFVATKGFLVQAAPRIVYSMEAVGNEPVVRFEVRPAGQMPSYPIDEKPAPVKGWTYIQSRITDTGGCDEDNRPYLDFNKDVVQANARGGHFVWDGHTSANMIRGRGIPPPPPTNLGHFHENMVELWIVIEGELDFLIEGEQLVTGTMGDVVQAPNERWHRATFHGTGMATRLAITPRNKEGQVHYFQTDVQEGTPSSVGSSAQVRTPDQMLINPDPKDWVTYGGTYNSHRYSQLKQVTTANASRLQAKWVYHLDGMVELEPTPIVLNGVMYISGFNRVDALDARTGNIIWKYQRQPPSATRQRGTAVYGDKVYVATSDSHLVALDARTGGVRWDVKSEGGYTITGGAPLVADGKVIVSGNRPNGFIQAFDAVTGKYAWTWSALPKPSDPAYATWGGATPAGAPIWVSGSFDPELNLIYYGTGQPNPEWTGLARPGDNLYSDSIVALDVKSGTLKWHFQNTPHDVHDWDSLETPVLIDATFRGQPRKLLLQANRNGFYYVLDRTNGEFLLGTPFVDQLDWATGLDAKGRPLVTPGHDPTVKGTTTCPSTMGATNWPPPTYSPDTRYLYVVVAEGCGVNVITSSTVPDSGTGYYESARKPWQAYVRAIDALTGKRVWDYKAVRSNHYGPGLLSTAGGIVFAPEQFGQVSVLDAKTGQSLWHFNTGDVITAAPATYSVEGQQFFAIASGTNVFAFGLSDSR